ARQDHRAPQTDAAPERPPGAAEPCRRRDSESDPADGDQTCLVAEHPARGSRPIPRAFPPKGPPPTLSNHHLCSIPPAASSNPANSSPTHHRAARAASKYADYIRRRARARDAPLPNVPEECLRQLRRRVAVRLSQEFLRRERRPWRGRHSPTRAISRKDP